MSKKKRDDVVRQRNSEGVSFEAAEYEAGLSEARVDLPQVNSFTLMELVALQEYAKDLDLTRACSAAGYAHPSSAAARMKKRDHIKAELAAIHDVWRTNFEMTAEHASARHIKLMNKFEKDYDRLPKHTERGESTIAGQLAGTLGKMSESYLKASGKFERDETESGQIVMNIYMDDSGVEVEKGGKKARVSRGKAVEVEKDGDDDEL